VKKEVQIKAAEMVLQDYLPKGETKSAEEAVREAGRTLTEEEARQSFDSALIQGKPFQAIEAAEFMPLSKTEKDRLLKACWSSALLFSALEVTGTTLSEKDFHRLVSRATKNWRSQRFIVILVQETGYELTDREKKAFLNCMIENQRGRGGYDEHLLQEGLNFLGDWLSSEDAERLFTVLEGYQFPDIALDSMIELAVLAKGRVNKYRILNKLSLLTRNLQLEILEKKVRQATGESLIANDYRYLFHAALKQKGRYVAAKIASGHPEIIKEHEFDDLILLSIRDDHISDITSLVKAAAGAGKLSLKSLKRLISEVQGHDYHVSFRIFVYALALERGIDPKEPQSVESEG
jgi:hypothetical protein